MARTVTASAPGKLMLLGEHAVVYGQPCLVTAVGQRMKAIVSETSERVLELEAPEVNVAGYRKSLDALGMGEIPKGAAFVEVAIRNLVAAHPLTGGVRVETVSEFSSQFGFGSSSASTVCVLRALSELLALALPPREIFQLAYKTVLDVQKKGSGFDVAAAVFGGTLRYQNGGEVLEPVELPDLPLVVGYSGIKADTVTLIDKVKALAEREPTLVQETYRTMGELVGSAHAAMIKRDWKTVGELMNLNQDLLSGLGVSGPELDAMIAAARRAGAYGAKLSGAGGGDCMIAVVPPEARERVSAAIQDAGGTPLDVPVHAEGVRLE